MNRGFVRGGICVLVLLLVGFFRVSYEDSVHRDFREKRLIPEQLNASTREKLGQRGAFIALGGLRSLVATWRSFVALEHFTNGDWVELEKEYDLITTLSPHNEYHWATGGWHLAYNASGYFQQQQGMLPQQRERLTKSYIRRGRQFFEDGIRNNPESWQLKSKLGNLYADEERYPDYEKAAELFLSAAESDDALDFYKRAAIYALARVPSRRQEAYDRLLVEWQSPENRLPMMQALRFALQENLNVPAEQRLMMKDIFGSPREAYFHLSNYYRRGDSFPQDKVLESLKALEESLKIPAERSRIPPGAQ